MAKARTHFLQGYLELSKGTEIPQLFTLWCGLNVISATLARRVYLDLSLFQVYPNLFTVLVAGSGRCRKSTSIGVAEGFLRTIVPPLNLISQRVTPESLIDAVRISNIDGASVRQICDGTVIADELSTFLNRRSYEAGIAPLLIQMFDCKPKFEYRTKGRGIELLQGTCLGLLGGSTIDYIKDAIPEDAIGGGLTSRIIFVYVETPEEPVPFPLKSAAKEVLALRLVDELERIRFLTGSFSLSSEGHSFFEQDYRAFYMGSNLFDSGDTAGYASRRHIHMLKLGMLFAVAEGDDLIIEKRHLEGAREALTLTEPSLPRVLNLITTTSSGTLVMLVRHLIEREGKITKSSLLQRVSHKMTARDLEEVISTLQGGGCVETVVEGSRIIYCARKPL